MAMSYAEAKIWNDEHLPILNRIGITTGVRDDRYGDPAGAFVEIVYTVHGRLKRAADLMSNDHSEFALAVAERLKEFAGIGGKYEQQAAAVINALTELDRVHRITELENEAEEHERAASKAYKKIKALISFKP
jgi:hypothetical protein|nr:MAG TPA: hypothetical protein [Caudoviricetes sp.]